MAITPQTLRKYEQKTSGVQLTEIWENKETTVEQKYSQWNKKVIEIALEKTFTKKRKKMLLSNSKEVRKLRKKKKMVRKKAKTIIDEDKWKLNRERQKIIQDHIINCHKREQRKRTENIARRIKQESGINRNNFWEYYRTSHGEKCEKVSEVYNNKGEIQRGEKEIKMAYKEYYENLLERDKMDTDEGREIEKIVEKTMKRIEQITKNKKIEEVTAEEMNNAIKKLKKRKAKDREGWKNEMIINGGKDMQTSFKKMLKQIVEHKIVPKEWTKIRIKSVHKKGSKKHLANQRGLFITNIVSKVVERILIERNKKVLEANMSPYQCGGIKNRSVADNLFILNSVMERYCNEKKNLYIIFTDLQKCFDKLWLEDAIIQLTKNGMNVEEAGYLYKMNKEVKAIITTPIGETEEIEVKNIVKQGTVAGPTMAGVVTDTINKMRGGKEIMFGPIQIKHPTFVDDIIAMGDAESMKDMEIKMQVLEMTKKFTFNNKEGKTNYMIIKNNKKQENEIKMEVKTGIIKITERYKYLGDIYTSDGKNTEKVKGRTEKIEFMAAEVKMQGSYERVGKGDTQVRKLLIETTIIPSILANTETWTQITENDMKMIDNKQYQMLKIVYEQPQGTPYWGIINETGLWPFSYIIKYKQLMWYHALIHSEEKRVAKKILEQQIKEKKNNWAKQVMRWGSELELDMNMNRIKNINKAKWKREIKGKSAEKIEKIIKEEAENKTKLRFIKKEKFEEKEYMKTCQFKTCKQIMKQTKHDKCESQQKK